MFRYSFCCHWKCIGSKLCVLSFIIKILQMRFICLRKLILVSCCISNDMFSDYSGDHVSVSSHFLSLSSAMIRFMLSAPFYFLLVTIISICPVPCSYYQTFYCDRSLVKHVVWNLLGCVLVCLGRTSHDEKKPGLSGLC